MLVSMFHMREAVMKGDSEENWSMVYCWKRRKSEGGREEGERGKDWKRVRGDRSIYLIR